jgi:hypothetical protein
MVNQLVPIYEDVRSHFGSRYGIACNSSPLSCSMDAVAIVAQLHGQLLRALSAHAGRHYEGLAQAARACRELPAPLKKRLLHIDSTFQVVRHITTPSAMATLAAVAACLEASPSPPRCDDRGAWSGCELQQSDGCVDHGLPGLDQAPAARPCAESCSSDGGVHEVSSAVSSCEESGIIGTFLGLCEEFGPEEVPSDDAVSDADPLLEACDGARDGPAVDQLLSVGGRIARWERLSGDGGVSRPSRGTSSLLASPPCLVQDVVLAGLAAHAAHVDRHSADVAAGCWREAAAADQVVDAGLRSAAIDVAVGVEQLSGLTSAPFFVDVGSDMVGGSPGVAPGALGSPRGHELLGIDPSVLLADSAAGDDVLGVVPGAVVVDGSRGLLDVQVLGIVPGDSHGCDDYVVEDFYVEVPVKQLFSDMAGGYLGVAPGALGSPRGSHDVLGNDPSDVLASAAGDEVLGVVPGAVDVAVQGVPRSSACDVLAVHGVPPVATEVSAACRIWADMQDDSLVDDDHAGDAGRGCDDLGGCVAADEVVVSLGSIAPSPAAANGYAARRKQHKLLKKHILHVKLARTAGLMHAIAMREAGLLVSEQLCLALQHDMLLMPPARLSSIVDSGGLSLADIGQARNVVAEGLCPFD